MENVPQSKIARRFGPKQYSSLVCFPLKLICLCDLLCITKYDFCHQLSKPINCSCWEFRLPTVMCFVSSGLQLYCIPLKGDRVFSFVCSIWLFARSLRAIFFMRDHQSLTDSPQYELGKHIDRLCPLCKMLHKAILVSKSDGFNYVILKAWILSVVRNNICLLWIMLPKILLFKYAFCLSASHCKSFNCGFP